MLIIFFLLFIKTLSVNLKYINLPFYTDQKISTDPKINMLNLFDNNIYTNIKIGSKSEKIPISIKLKSYPFYVIGEETKTEFNNQIYHQSKSSTFKNEYDINILGGEDFHNASVSNDKFKIGQIENLFDFILTKNLNEKKKIYQGGSFGFCLANLNSAKLTNFSLIRVLKTKGLISKMIVALNYEDNNDKGNLIIGTKPDEIDDIYKEEDFISCNTIINEDIYWGYKFDNIIIDNKNIANYFSFITEFAFELNYILAPLNISYYYENMFFNEYIKNNKCFKDNFKDDRTSFYHFYYCDSDVDITKLKNISFYNKKLNYVFNLTYEDLFVKIKGKYYFQMVFSNYNSDDWVFGKPFFKRYLIVFDFDSKTFGIYKKIGKKSFFKRLINALFSSTFLLIIAFLIIIGLIIYIYFIVTKKQRRKRANELIDEDYDYLPNNI